MVCSLSQYSIESAHRLNNTSKVIIVYQLGVSKYTGRLAKKMLYSFGMLVNLLYKLVW